MKEMPVENLDESKLTLIHGDCTKNLKLIESESVDLLFTSPPYAEQRKGKYFSIPAEQYIEWFSPIATEIRRILKSTGSFFLNLAPNCTDGEKQLYVMELVLHLRI
jgi:DNA modification methylase